MRSMDTTPYSLDPDHATPAFPNPTRTARRMLLGLPAFLRIPLALLLVALNLLVHATPLLALALAKALVPIDGFRRVSSRWLVALAESWIAGNGVLLRLFTRIEWQVTGLEPLRYGGWYLVVANHQSWV